MSSGGNHVRVVNRAWIEVRVVEQYFLSQSVHRQVGLGQLFQIFNCVLASVIAARVPVVVIGLDEEPL